VVLGVALAALLSWTVHRAGSPPQYVDWIICSIPGYMVALIAIFPILKYDSRRMEINSNMHLFITRMGVLSTSELPRKDLMELLASVKEYGALTDEMKKIYNLIEFWNFSLPESARYVGKRCPSPILADFLNRMAHSIDSGENFSTFLRKEQAVVMTEYQAMYEGAMRDLDLLKEIFVATITAAMFMIVFVSILPMFVAQSSLMLLLGCLLVFLFVEVSLVFFTYSKLPKDNIWHNMAVRPYSERRLKRVLPFAFLIAGVLFAVLLLKTSLPLPMIFAISVSALAGPAFYLRRMENELKRCDDNYDSYMRAIASAVETVGGGIDDALRRLKGHDFGPLSVHADQLYKRLIIRIDEVKAWSLFAAHTGSNLISKFTEMYVRGIESGGKPSEIGKLISDNYIRMLTLRKYRYQAASSMAGVLYGLLVAITFTLYLMLSIMRMMNGVFSLIDIKNSQVAVPLLSTHFQLEMFSLFFLIIIVTHILMSSWFMRIISGSHPAMPILHLIAMSWIVSIVAFVSDMAMSKLIRVGGV
jgi:flagellar protein FlaJ